MDFHSWCRQHFPGGTFTNGGDDYSCKNHFRGEKNASLSFSDSKRSWNDFATGEGGRASDFCREHGLPEWDGGPEHREGKISIPPLSPDKGAEVIRLWNSAVPAKDHPYLYKKGISGENCRVVGDLLLVPGYDHAGNLVGVERIDATGGKKHLGSKSGAFFPCGDLDEGKPVYVCEGAATAASVHELTDCPTVAAFGTNNLLAVAKALKGRDIIVCPDADKAGRKAADECRGAGYKVVELPEGSPDGYDWNDLACERGIEAGKDLFRERWKLSQAESKEPAKKSLRSFRRNLEPSKGKKPEMIGGIFPRGGVSILAGQQGSGKSMLMQKFCSDVSLGGEILDGVTDHAPKGKTLFLVGEFPIDSMNDRQRTTQWEHDDENLVLYSRLDFAKAETPFDMTDADGWSNILGVVRDENPDMIVFDSFMSFNAADESDMKSMQSAFTKLLKLADEMKAAVVLVHHIRKRKTVERQSRLHMDDIIGSSIITRNASVAIGAETLEIDGVSWVFVNTLKTWYAPMDEFAFKIERDEYKVLRGIEINLEPKSPGASRMEAIENAVFVDHKDGNNFTAKEIEEATGASAIFVRKMLKKWTDEKRLRKGGGSKNTSYSIMQYYQNDIQTVGTTEKDSDTAVSESIRITYGESTGERDSDTGSIRMFSGDTKASDGILILSHDTKQKGNDSDTALEGNLIEFFPEGVEGISPPRGALGTPPESEPTAEAHPPKLPAPSGAFAGGIDWRDVPLEEAEAWAASIPELVAKLKERAEREHDPIMSKSPQALYESLVRMKYAETHASPSRGPSLKEIAERAGVPPEAVREELERWQAAGRVTVGEDGSISLLAGTAFPDEVKPEEPDEESGAVVDEPPDAPLINWQSVAPDVAVFWVMKQDESTQAEYRQRVAELESSAPELLDPRGRAARELYARTCGEEGFEDEKLPVV